MLTRILVAEDNAINRMVAVKLLETEGYLVDVAGNGEEAVAAYMRRSYDLVLMDCQMPKMEGLEAARHIRAMDKPQPIIVAVTALNSQQSAE